jgi:glycosyltransferase involved in cell wall biosynthesis
MSEMLPAVSVVVPCRNERAHIEGFVSSILAQEAPPGGFEIIIADGMSSDGTRDVLTRAAGQDSRLRIIDNPERIVSTGLNRAIAAARGGVIVRVDVHTEYAPDYLRQCHAVLEETGADNVGGPWIAAGRGYVSCAIAAAFQSPFGSGGAHAHDPSYEGAVDTVYLGCWRREYLQRIGGFDEQLVRNQDDELNLRICRTGGAVWQCPKIRSRYFVRGSLTALFKQYLQYGYWKVRVIQKHRLPASLRQLVPAAFVLSLVSLSILSPVARPAQVALAGVAASYLACNLTASVVTAARSRWISLPVLPLVFLCYHLGYGVGFLRGIVDVVFLGRGASARMSALTR